jgi:hypothetical protein
MILMAEAAKQPSTGVLVRIPYVTTWQRTRREHSHMQNGQIYKETELRAELTF